MRINTVTNENENIKEKVNFFVDWLNYYTRCVGKNNSFQLENPLSIVEKIIIQIEKNDKYSLPYLNNYFSNELFSETDYLKHFNSYEQLRIYIDQYMTSDKVKRRQMLDSRKFISLLKLFKDELSNKMVTNSVKELNRIFSCEHKLDEHIVELKLHTQLIVSEFLFKKRTKDEIRKVIRNILKKDVNTFPFPPNVKNQREKEAFLKKRSLKQQFEGLSNFMFKTTSKETFLFKLYGVEFDDNVSFKYNEVTFYSRNHSKFKTLKKILSQNNFAKRFFEDDGFIIATVEVEQYDTEHGQKAALEIIKKELNYLSLISKRDITVDSSNSYINTTTWKKFGWVIGGKRYRVPYFDMDTYKDNPFDFLKNIKSPSKEHFLSFEHIYINASRYNSIPDHWHYLETILSLRNNEKAIQNKVSTIVLKNELDVNQSEILRLLYSIVDVHYWGDIQDFFNPNQIKLIKAALVKKQIHKLLRSCQYPFIQELIKEHDGVLSKSKFLDRKRYYQNILMETYEQRNFHIHMASTNDKAIVKLNNTLPKIIARFRWVLFDGMRKHPNLTFDALVDVLYADGTTLI